MKESIGYTATLNIIIIFLIVVFAFLSATLIYFRSTKTGKIITSEIEKCEGYNNCSIVEINTKLNDLGYNMSKVNCSQSISDKNADNQTCAIVPNDSGNGTNGYCVYLCYETGGEYYYYKIDTRMRFNLPFVDNLIPIPIYTTTNRMYNFESKLEGAQ